LQISWLIKFFMVNLAFVLFFECEITYRRFFMNLFLGYVMQPYDCILVDLYLCRNLRKLYSVMLMGQVKGHYQCSSRQHCVEFLSLLCW